MGRPKGAPNKPKPKQINILSPQTALTSIQLVNSMLVVVNQVMIYLQRTNTTQYFKFHNKIDQVVELSNKFKQAVQSAKQNI